MSVGSNQSQVPGLVNALCGAIKSNNISAIELLLKSPLFHNFTGNKSRHSGVKIINKRNHEGYTPLHVAVMFNKKNIVKMLLSKRISSDVRLKTIFKGNTCGHVAAFNGYNEILKMLILKGANVNDMNNRKFTLLHTACLSNQYESCVVLIKNGANPNIKNKQNKFAWELTTNQKIKDYLGIKNDGKGKEKGNCDGICANEKFEYKIIEKIAHGGFASVYLALNLKNNEFFAIKKILISKETKNLKDIEKEIIFLKNLSQHRNVIQYLGCEKKETEFDEFFLIFMEYCKSTIKKFFKGLKTMEKKTFFMQIYLKQILEGLVYLHENGIIHRDIKPSNILLSNNVVKLSDFGSAKSILNNPSGNMTFIGTPQFIPPEICAKQEERSKRVIPEKLDIYSLGLTIMHLLAGELWDTKQFHDNISLIMFISQLKKPLKIKEEITNKNLRDLISSCIDLRPEVRPSAKKLLKHPFFNESLDFSLEVEWENGSDDSLKKADLLNVTTYKSTESSQYVDIFDKGKGKNNK